MGQYHKLVNLDKKEIVHPHQIGNGLKLREQVGWDYSTSTVLVMLLAACSGRGGGDFEEHKLVGSWAGDRIAFIGDYAEPSDILNCDAKHLWDVVCAACDGCGKEATDEFKAEVKQWKNISPKVRRMMEEQFDIEYKGDGWMNIEKAGDKQKPAMAPDMVLRV